MFGNGDSSHIYKNYHICFLQAELLQYLPRTTSLYIALVLWFCGSAVLQFCGYAVMRFCIVNLNGDSAWLGMVLLLFGSVVL